MPGSAGYCVMAPENQTLPLLPGIGKARSRNQVGRQSPRPRLRHDAVAAETGYQ